MVEREQDVIVVGAGLSGICAAYYLKHRSPGYTFGVLEARDELGGTWDLFDYPGLRSDSDMYTFGFSFHPWRDAGSIASGDVIMRYLHETVETYGLGEHITYGARVERASWSSTDQRWTLHVRRAGGAQERWRCKWLWACTGYYRYDRGHMPEFAGQEDFDGELVHPQLWDETIEWAGRRVVVIGSGATAVTLVPALAEDAAQVTMLQRSPSYIMSRPGTDPVAKWLKARLPERLAHGVVRWKNILLSTALYQYSRRFPEHARGFYIGAVREELGEVLDVDEHFTPRYDPWDQRLCLIPDGDLFEALREGRATIVTDHIRRFVPEGIELESGRRLEADLIVAATGLELQAFGGAQIEVDGQELEASEAMMYRGTMLAGVPNFSFSVGYTNASWTLKCELTSRWVCRLLRHMRREGHQVACPREDPEVEPRPLLDLTSGYLERARDRVPVQGSRLPWRLYQNYVLDRWMLQRAALVDEALELRP